MARQFQPPAGSGAAFPRFGAALLAIITIGCVSGQPLPGAEEWFASCQTAMAPTHIYHCKYTEYLQL